MDASPAPRLGRRFVLATLVVGAIAAAHSGPALADPGLPPLVSSLPEPVSGAVSDPVQTVSETASGAVEDTTSLVDDTLPGVVGDLEQTVNEPVGDAAGSLGTAAGSESRGRQQAPHADAGTAGTPIPVTSSPLVGPRDTSVAPPDPSSPGRLATVAPDPQVPAQAPVVRDRLRSAPAAGPEPPTTRPASPTPTRGTLTEVTREVARGTAYGTVGQEPRSHGAPLRPDGLLPESATPAPLLLALLLGLLMLAVPSARGRRLSLAVALAHAVDVRFRLVRPG